MTAPEPQGLSPEMHEEAAEMLDRIGDSQFSSSAARNFYRQAREEREMARQLRHALAQGEAASHE